MAYDEWAFGENNTTQGETEVSWATWSDGAGGAPTITGDPDWGKLELASGEEARSLVYDMGDSLERIYALEENRYGTGQEDAVLQIRGDTVSFNQDDASPAWETYTAPITRTWRYVQVREINSLLLMETFEANPGYDNEGWIEYDTVDPDSSIPGGITEWGSECLRCGSLVSQDNGGITYNLSGNYSSIYCSFEIYTPLTYDADNEDWYLQIIGDGNEYIEINGTTNVSPTTYKAIFHTKEVTDFEIINKGQKYKFEIYQNLITGDWKWTIDGIEKGSGNDACDLEPFHIIQLYLTTAQSGDVIYLDNIEIHTEPIEW